MGRSHDPAALLIIAPFDEQMRGPAPSPLSPPIPPSLPHVKDLCLPHSGQLMRVSENTEVGLNEEETLSEQKNRGAAAFCLVSSFFFPRCLSLTNEPQSAPLMKEVINIL